MAHVDHALRTIESDMQPRLYQLDHNLFVLAFRCMKLVPAHYILTRALEAGELTSGGTVVESTSGTFGLGLARVCRAYDLHAHLVSDPAIDAPLRARLELLGATVDIVGADDAGSYQRPRLRRLREVLDATGGFWPRQYDNPMNPRSYHGIIDNAAQALNGRVDHLVAACGSGGSGSGCAARMAELGHHVRLHAVDTPGSVLFGQTDRRRDLRGLGNSLLPSNVAYNLIDYVHWVPAGLAFSAACRIARSYGGLDVGPTSGAAFLAARHIARRFPNERVLAIFADDGERYRTTYLSRPWLELHGLSVDPDAASPLEVDHPLDAGDEWTVFAWRRRSLDAVRTQRSAA